MGQRLRLGIVMVDVDWHEVMERNASGIKVKSWGRRRGPGRDIAS